MNSFLNSIQDRVLLYDGSKGVMLQRRGLKGNEAPESWNVSKPDVVKDLYNQYKEAGSDVIQTNTFTGNRVALEKYSLGDKTYQLNFEGVKLAKEVAGDNPFVAASVGPTGLILEPAGDLSFEKAYSIFSEQLRAIEDAGANLVNFETFTDLNELRAAILAAKETTSLPIIASVTFENSRTMSGNSAEVCAIVCESLGVSVVGANCSGGPDSLLEPIKRMHALTSIPLSVKANAGMPKILNGEAVYTQTPEQFSSYTKEFVENGVRIIGGCCGTSPEFIRALKKELDEIIAPDLELKSSSTITSAFNHLVLSKDKNYSAKELSFKDDHALEMLKNGDFFNLLRDYNSVTMDYLVIDLGDLRETSFDIWGFISTLSFAIKKPLILKSETVEILYKFLRYYPGRVGVVSSDSTEISLPKLKHYGALILDDEWKC